MMFDKRFGLMTLMAAALLIVPTATMADMMTWTLDVSNTFPEVITYATVEITTNNVTGVVDFSVDPTPGGTVPASYGTLGSNFGVQEFGFNFSGSSTWTAPAGFMQQTNKNLSIFGVFNYLERDPGTGHDPFDFSITLSIPAEAILSNFAVANANGNLFAAHIKGFGEGPNDTVESHWIGGGNPIPTPGASLLGVIGLTTVGAIRRRND